MALDAFSVPSTPSRFLVVLLNNACPQQSHSHINCHIIILLLPVICAKVPLMKKTHFEWDEGKDQENQTKHKVSFSLVQHAFLDPHRIILEDEEHRT